MRKIFTKLFSLTLLMYFVSSLAVTQAQTCDITLSESNVVLLTDITTKCDSDLIQYAVTGFPDSTYYNFNSYAGDSTAAGFTLDSTIWVTEGTGFTVQVLYNGTCYSQVLDVPGEDLIQPVYIDTLLVTQPLCSDDKGELTVVAGGTESFLVNFVDSAGWYDSGKEAGTDYTEYSGTQFQADPGTEYFVRVISANGCTSLGWDSISISNAPVTIEIADVNTNIDTLICVGDTAEVTVEGIAGGTAPYYVTLSDGQKDTLDAAGDIMFYVVEPGTYTATVVDTLGCSVVSDSSAVITGPEPIDFVISLDDVACADSATGTIYVFDITGGTASSTYTATLVGTDTAMVDVAPSSGDTIVFDGLAAGYYSVWVKDAACGLDSTAYDNPNGTGNVISVQAPGEIELAVVTDTSICIGESSVITASATGGSGTYEFQLDSAGTLTGWSATSTWTVPDVTADYVVWVRDAGAGSCELAWPVISISANTPVAINGVTTISPTCPGGNDGVINIEAAGDGTLWYSLDSTSWKTNNIFAVFAGDYTVYVRTDACENDVATTDVTVNALDTNIISIVDVDSIDCYGAANGQIVFTTEKWASQTGEIRDITIYGMLEGSTTVDSIMSSGVGTNDTISDLEAGVYYFWAVDDMGCVLDADLNGVADTLTAVITEVDELTVNGSVTGDASCYGNYDGVMTIYATEGVTEYGHANTLQAAMNLSNAAFSVWPTDADSVNIQVGKGTYYVVVKNDCGEKAYDGPFTVGGLDPVTIADTALMVSDNDCYGDTIGYIEVAAASGGSNDLVYTLQMLDNGVWVDVDAYVQVDVPMFEHLPSDTFKVVVSDLVGGCDGDETNEIIVGGPDAPVMISTLDSMDITCFGESDGLISITATGGYGPYEFKVGTTNWRAFPEGSNSKNIVITEKGTYTVWVRDSLGCISDPATATIAEPEEIVVTVSKKDVTDACNNDNGEITVEVEGGHVGSDFFIQIPGVDTTTVATDSVTFTGVAAGEYVITVIEDHANACEMTAEVVVQGPDTITAVATILDSVACYGSTGGDILVQVSGGTPGYEVQIDGVDTLRGDSVVFEDLYAGTYTIVVQDTNDCTYTLGSVTIGQADSIELTATWISDITCDPGYGQFSIQADGGSGEFVYYAAISQLPAHVLVPDPMASDEWQTDSIFNVTEAGTYIVWAYDTINGCLVGGEDLDGVPVNEWRVKIAEPSIIVDVNATVVGNTECYGATFEITVPADSIMITEDGLDITDPLEYTVMIDTVVGSTLTGVGPGIYVVVVTHESGCYGTDTVVIAEQEVFEVVLDKGEGEFTCPDVVEGYLEANVVSGGGDTLEYQLWQDGTLKTDYQPENSFLVRINHEYTVVVRDENGCTDTSNVMVLDPVADIDFELTDVTCSDDTMASVLVEVTGEPGRMFQVWWQQFEVESGVYTDTSVWFSESIKLDQMFIFDNENVKDIHYAFTIIDDKGCTTGVDTMTFDQIITAPLELTVTEGETGECTTEVTVTAAGGVAPYTIMVNGEETTESVLELGGGTYEISVMDAHQCLVIEEVTLEYGISADTTLETYTGEAVQLVVEDAMLDTMLYAGEYSFYYDADTACIAELNVIVTEKDRVMPVLDTVTPTDTIADNHAVFTIVFEDVVTFNDSVMGYLTVTQKDSAEATLEIPVTADMVSGNTITVDYNYEIVGKLDLNTTYTVAVDSGIVMGDGLAWDGVTGTWEFTTGPDWATGVEDLQPETLEFSVYPNPFNDFIRIDNADKLDRVIVSNIAGQRILDIEYPSYEIRTGNLTTGVYVITLIADDEIVKSDRIIKR